MSSHSRHAAILLRGGALLDGTGQPGRPADLAIKGDRISAIGDLSRWTADLTLNVTGLVVAPGFIDMHSHSDLALLANPRAESKLRQGVTTEVIGQCGFSPAPAPEGQQDAIRALFGSWGQEVDWTWGSFADYLDALRRHPTSVNVVPLVGHSTIRVGAMGQDNRPPTPSELVAMQDTVRAAMDDGAFGMSTGLIYAPGMFADTEELVALASALAPANGIYFSHIRSEAENLLGAIAEAIEIGRRAGVPVQIAHLKAEGRSNWGKAEAALEAIDKARAQGVDITFDVYPYTAWNTSLAQLLPTWARAGGPEAIVERLREPTSRSQVRAEIAAAASADPGRWDRRLLASVDSDANRPLQGLTIAQIAERRGADPEDVVIDLLVEERADASMVGFAMDENGVRRIISHPLAMIGSDAAAAAPYGLLGRGHPHPRTYGTFPRILGRYVREEGLLTLEDAVAKMTSHPAARLGLTDRGQLAVGLAADIVVFDPNTIADRATYQDPHQYPTGIRCVIVNGILELDGNDHNDRRPGRVFSRTDD
jgi:N-acyl-D-amino-acid deacylase